MSATDASRPAAGRFYRKELVALLDHCVRVPLTLLLAPAGAGKSTLLQNIVGLALLMTFNYQALGLRSFDAVSATIALSGTAVRSHGTAK